jgi:hypothetical protein
MTAYHDIDEREAIQAEGDDSDLRHELRRLGIATLLVDLGLIAPVRGHIDAGRFEPHPDGPLTAAVHVRTGRGPCVGGVALWWVLHGPQRDIVAIDLRDPARFGLLGGAADWVGAVPLQVMAEPVVIHRDPIAWLRARCQGVALLTRDERARQRVLREFRRLAAADLDHGLELRRVLELPPQGQPGIFVQTGRAA